MAKKVEKKKLEKRNWVSNFNLVGAAKIGDYTFATDNKSTKSDWIYSKLNLGVDCGTNGIIYCDMMGGYGEESNNVLYVHGKDGDKDDFNDRYEIDWEDRFDSSVTDNIGDRCFIKVGIEKDKTGKTFVKKFLSPYDAIAYIKDNLTNETVVNVRGNLKYSIYNDNVQVKKEITSIYLSEVDKVENYKATFTQTMLLTKDSVGSVDKETGVLPIYAKVLDYVKTWKGKEVKTFVPFSKTFEYELDLENKEKTQKIIAKLFKVKKGVTEITLEGNIVEGGTLITMTKDDIPDDIKELIDIGVYTEEEALTKCTAKKATDKKMVIKRPVIKLVGEEDSKTPVIQKFEEKYSEEDLILDFMFETEEDDDEDEIDVSTVSDNDSEDWLDAL